jgi:hypothetical protein
VTDLEAAWNAVHDERRQWVQYAFDPSERPSDGLRSREWTAVGASEVEVVREMAGRPGTTELGRLPGHDATLRAWRPAPADGRSREA